jgi:hypothetical protein
VQLHVLLNELNKVLKISLTLKDNTLVALEENNSGEALNVIRLNNLGLLISIDSLDANLLAHLLLKLTKSRLQGLAMTTPVSIEKDNLGLSGTLETLTTKTETI